MEGPRILVVPRRSTTLARDSQDARPFLSLCSRGVTMRAEFAALSLRRVRAVSRCAWNSRPFPVGVRRA
jgi:hypothetical protein